MCRAQAQPARLCGCDIDPIRQRRDHQARAIDQVLITIWEAGVADLDPAVSDVLVPVAAQLAHPEEAVGRCCIGLYDVGDHVAAVGVDGDHVHDLLAVGLCQIGACDLDQPRQLLDLGWSRVQEVAWLAVAGVM